MAVQYLATQFAPGFDAPLLGDQFYIKAGFYTVKTATQRNNIKSAYRRLDGFSNTMVFVSDVNRLYKLINEPGTSTTTNSDWEEIELGSGGALTPVGEWDPTTNTPELTDANATGRNGEFYFVINAGTGYNYTDADLFDGELVEVFNGDWIVSVGDKWVVLAPNVTWDSITKPQSIIDYVNGTVIAHNHGMGDITGLSDALNLKYSLSNTADHEIDFNLVDDKAITEVEFLKEWYYNKTDIDILLSVFSGGGGGGGGSFLGLTDTPNGYSGNAGKFVRVNGDEDELEFAAVELTPFSDALDILKNAADATKLARFNLNNLTTATTRTYSLPDLDGGLVLGDGVRRITVSDTEPVSPELGELWFDTIAPTSLAGYGITDAWNVTGTTTITSPTLTGSATFTGQVTANAGLVAGATGTAGVLSLKRAADGGVTFTITQGAGSTVYNNGQGSGHVFTIQGVTHLTIGSNGDSLFSAASIALTSRQGLTLSTTFIASAGAAVATQLAITPTYNLTASFSGTAIGVDYNPTLNSTTGLTNLAFRAVSGEVLIGGSTITALTRLDVRGASGGTNVARFATSANAEIMVVTTGSLVRLNNLYALNNGDLNIFPGRDGIINMRPINVYDVAGASNTLLRITSSTIVGFTSGTNTVNLFDFAHVLNTSGGTTTLRGIYYNPSVTGSTGATHIAYENTSGQIRLSLTQDDTKTRVLVQDGTTKQVFWRDAATLGGSGGTFFGPFDVPFVSADGVSLESDGGVLYFDSTKEIYVTNTPGSIAGNYTIISPTGFEIRDFAGGTAQAYITSTSIQYGGDHDFSIFTNTAGATLTISSIELNLASSALGLNFTGTYISTTSSHSLNIEHVVTFQGSTGVAHATLNFANSITYVANDQEYFAMFMNPTVNAGAYTGTKTYGIYYSPSGTVGLTHYGLIIASGMTGLGTTGPTAKLHVHQSALPTTPIDVTSSNIDALLRYSTTSTGNFPTVSIYQGRVATTNATVTTLSSVTIPGNNAVLITGYVIARRTGGVSGTAQDCAAYRFEGLYKNSGGTAIAVGAPVITVIGESQAGWNVGLTISSGNVLIEVTGAASNDVTWHLSELKIIHVNS